MKKLLFCLIVVLLVGCSQEASEGKTEQNPLPIVEVEDVTTTFTHPDTQQDFSIVRTDKFLQNYIDKVQSNPDQYDNYKTYAETFVDPLTEVCMAEDVSKNDAYSEGVFAERPALSRLGEIELLTEQMDEEQVTANVKEALLHSASLIPGEEPTTVCIFPTTEASGVNYLGSALVTGNISIFVNQYMNESDLLTTVAHEYNHSVLFEQFAIAAEEDTLLDFMVIEGKAVLFEEIAYPEHFSWDIHEYEGSLWQEAEEHLHEQNRIADAEIMYGSETFPINYGYNEGYKILSEYLERHPDMEMEDWMAASAEEIYEGSHYASYYD